MFVSWWPCCMRSENNKEIRINLWNIRLHILKYFGPNSKLHICKARTPWGCIFWFLAVFARWSRFEWEKIEQLHSFLFQKFRYQYNVADINYFSNSDQVCSSTYATGLEVTKLLWSTFHTQVYIPQICTPSVYPKGFHELFLYT